MRLSCRLGMLLTVLIPTASIADDRIAAPAPDLAPAYRHPEIAPSRNTRAMSVSGDGRFTAYVVQMPVEHEAQDSAMFLATGAPTVVAQGAQIQVLDMRSRASHQICPASGNDWDPVWSPDGSRLAFYSDRSGESRLWVYERASDSCRQVSDRQAKSLLWAHEEPRWSPDGTRIYFSVWPTSGNGAPGHALAPVAPRISPPMEAGGVTVFRHQPTGAAGTATRQPASQDFDARCGPSSYLASSLAAVAADGSRAARILVDADAQAAPSASERHFPSPYFRLSKSGRWITYFDTPCRRADNPRDYSTRLYAMPAAGGRPILVADNLRASIGGDEAILDYRWSPRADELVFARDGELWRVVFGPDGPGAPHRLGESLGRLSPALHWYSEDGAIVVVGTRPVQRGMALMPFANDIDLAAIPVDGGAPVPITVDRDHWSIDGVLARDDRALLQPGPTSFRLLGRDKRTGDNVVLTFDWRSRTTSETWRGRGRFHDLQPGAGGLVGLYEDFRTPTNVFTYSRDLTNAAQVSDVAPDLRRAAVGQYEAFDTVIPQHDGSLQTVQTAVLLPLGAHRGDRLPAVVWFYPGEDLTERLGQFGAPAVGDPAYLFTSRGYAVVLTNVMIGPGEQRGHAIDEIMDSLMPQVHRAADLGYVDINRLAIRGHSFGGYGTAAIIARTTLFRAAIASAGVYDLGGSYADTDFLNGEPIDRSRWSETAQPRLGQPVWSDPMRYIENSPYYLADRIRTPLLILQGTDDFTGSREGSKMFSALRRLDRTVELALYQGGGHTPAFWPTPQAVDQVARILDFLNRYIGPGQPPTRTGG